MTLSGRWAWVGLGLAAAVGFVGGSFSSGWDRARGVPATVIADAGVSVQVDAGIAAKADCSAEIADWKRVQVPLQGRTRYVYIDAGVYVPVPPETVTVFLPELRLSGSSASVASVQDSASAAATASVVVQPAAPERHWEAGPAALYGFSGQQVLWGGSVGWSAGPFGVRVQVMKGPGDVYAGGALVWRF